MNAFLKKYQYPILILLADAATSTLLGFGVYSGLMNTLTGSDDHTNPICSTLPATEQSICVSQSATATNFFEDQGADKLLGFPTDVSQLILNGFEATCGDLEPVRTCKDKFSGSMPKVFQYYLNQAQHAKGLVLEGVRCEGAEPVKNCLDNLSGSAGFVLEKYLNQFHYSASSLSVSLVVGVEIFLIIGVLALQYRHYKEVNKSAEEKYIAKGDLYQSGPSAEIGSENSANILTLRKDYLIIASTLAIVASMPTGFLSHFILMNLLQRHTINKYPYCSISSGDFFNDCVKGGEIATTQLQQLGCDTFRGDMNQTLTNVISSSCANLNDTTAICSTSAGGISASSFLQDCLATQNEHTMATTSATVMSLLAATLVLCSVYHYYYRQTRPIEERPHISSSTL